MNPIQIIFDANSSITVSNLILNVIPRDFNETDTTTQIQILSTSIGNILHGTWPNSYSIKKLSECTQFNIPFNFKPKNWTLLFNTALNVLLLDNAIETYNFTDTDEWYIANPRTDKFITYFDIYRHFTSSIFYSFNVLFENIDNKSIDEYNESLIETLIPYVHDTYHAIDKMYNAFTVKQIACAYAKLFINLGYMNNNVYPNISFIDVDATNENDIQSIEINKGEEEIEEISEETDVEIKEEIKTEEEPEKDKKEIENEQIESLQNVWEEHKDIIKIEETENESEELKEETVQEKETASQKSTPVVNKYILTIMDLKEHTFEKLVKYATIEIDISLLDNFIAHIEKNRDPIDEENLIELVRRIKPKNIYISNKQCMILLTGALYHMGYEPLLKDKIINYKTLIFPVHTTQFIPDDTVYPQAEIVDGYQMKYAEEYQPIDRAFESKLDEYTTLVIYQMNHKEIMNISDHIIEKVKRNVNFYGTRCPLVKTRITQDLYNNKTKLTYLIKYISKFWIAQYKKEMTPNRLKLHLYQVMYFVFKKFIEGYKRNVHGEIRDAIMEFVEDFFDGNTTCQMNKMFDSVHKNGGVPVIYFHYDFKLTKDVIDAKPNEKEIKCDIKTETEQHEPEVSVQKTTGRSIEKRIGLKMLDAYQEMMAKHQDDE